MKDFRDLKVWDRAHRLTLEVYRATGRFPREELFGPTSQMRRCSASMGANIAEGCGSRGNAEFHRFLQIAGGAGSELDYHILLAHDLHFLAEADYRKLTADLTELRKMRTSLLQKVDFERVKAKC
jgi:four helix bundle protein